MDVRVIAQQMELAAERAQGIAWIGTGLIVIQGMRLGEAVWRKRMAGTDFSKRMKRKRKQRQKNIKKGTIGLTLIAAAAGGIPRTAMAGSEEVVLSVDHWEKEHGWKEIPKESWETYGIDILEEENIRRIMLSSTGIYRIAEKKEEILQKEETVQEETPEHFPEEGIGSDEEEESLEKEPVSEEEESSEKEIVLEEGESSEKEIVLEEEESSEKEPVLEEEESSEKEPVLEEEESSEKELVLKEEESSEGETALEEGKSSGEESVMKEEENPKESAEMGNGESSEESAEMGNGESSEESAGTEELKEETIMEEAASEEREATEVLQMEAMILPEEETKEKVQTVQEEAIVQAEIVQMEGMKPEKPLLSERGVLWADDRTKPGIRMKGVQEKLHYKEGMEIQAEISDEWLDAAKTTCCLVGEKGEKYILEEEQQEGKKRFVWRQDRWEKEKPEGLENGRYELQMYGEDFAGNKKEQRIPFVLNRAGSVCQLVTERGKEEGESRVTVVEENLSPVTQHKLLYIWDGEPQILQEGTEYTVKAERQGEKYIYRYQIDEKYLQKNGNHTMQILSQDQAGNTKRNPVTFQINKEGEKEKRKEKQENASIGEKQAVCHPQTVENGFLFCLAAIGSWYGKIRKRRRKTLRSCCKMLCATAPSRRNI